MREIIITYKDTGPTWDTPLLTTALGARYMFEALGLTRGQPSRETCIVTPLDDFGHPLGNYPVHGFEEGVGCPARLVFRVVLQMGVSQFLMSHCHPSGDPTPSAADIKTTNALVTLGNLHDISMAGHIVLGHTGMYHSILTHSRGTLDVDAICAELDGPKQTNLAPTPTRNDYDPADRFRALELD